MRNPTAHQIQDHAVRREALPVELCNGCYGPVVYVGNEPRRLVEQFVWDLIVALEPPC